MKAEKLLEIFKGKGIDYFCGVPDSQLASFIDAVVNEYAYDPHHHNVAVNEGCAVGMAAGYYLSTGRTPCVYMQNSGLGNAVNPITSLLNSDVYGIGCLFVIGYRGEPAFHDEPQHVFMGKITLPLLDLLNIKYILLTKDTDATEFAEEFSRLSKVLTQGESVAIVVSKGALSVEQKHVYSNDYQLNRENVIELVSELTQSSDCVVVSTTGKISRELYEARKRQGIDSGKDFLTVGSMGHCSSIALSIATDKPNKKVFVLDGDGAVLMHLGALATIGSQSPKNLIHILLDNSAHETVGGLPTVSASVDLAEIALSSGYVKATSLHPRSALCDVRDTLLLAREAEENGAVFLRIPTALGSRADLGRPKERAAENKASFMSYLSKEEKENV